MLSSQTNTLKKDKLVLADYFINPVSQRQKQYEAVRAIVLENQSADTVATKFGYKISTVYSLVRNFKAEKIVTYREEEELSVPDISCRLAGEKIDVSERTRQS